MTCQPDESLCFAACQLFSGGTQQFQALERGALHPSPSSGPFRHRSSAHSSARTSSERKPRAHFPAFGSTKGLASWPTGPTTGSGLFSSVTPGTHGSVPPNPAGQQLCRWMTGPSELW